MKNPTSITLSILLAMLLGSTSRAQAIEEANLPLQLIDDVEVASLDAGVITRVHVSPGDFVRVGDPLFELDREMQEGEAAVKRTAWMVAEAEANNEVDLRYSRKTLLLNDKTLEKSLNAVRAYAKSISETEIDKLRLERDRAALSIEQAEVEREVADLTARLRSMEKDLAELELHRRSVQSPLDGTVVEVTAQPGEAVGAGKTVIRIISTRRLRLIAHVDRRFAFRLKPGDSGEFILQFNQKRTSYPGTIVFVSPEIRFTEQTFDVWIDIENANGTLLPGMKGSVKISVP